MFKNKLILQVLLVQRIRKRLCRKSRSMYIRPIFLNRDFQGDQVLVKELRSDEFYHFKYFGMDQENFDEILGRINFSISHPHRHARPISPIERLALTLRYLVSGNSQISLSLSYKIFPASVCLIVRETMNAICNALSVDCLPSPTKDIWTMNERDFALLWNYENCCGAIDGKHIRIRAPKGSGSSFYNYKSYFSIVLFAIANAKYQFTAVDIGCAGSESDGGILMRSTIGKCLASGNFGIPDPKPVSSGGDYIPCVILRDSGFPLKPYLMTPYTGEFLSKDDRIFNYRLSRARMVVENSFGILAARFSIYHTPIDAKEDLVQLITRTSILLHNFLMKKKDFNNMTVDRLDNGEVPGNWRETVQADQGMTPMVNQGSNNYSNNAASIRNKFKEYFVDVGTLNWQDRHVCS